MFRALILLLFLAACGRPLTDTERAFASTIHGDALDLDRVRLHDGAPTRAVTFTRKPRPRTTCRELIFPPQDTEELVTTKPAAVALWNTVLFDRDWYLDDYLPDYPDRVGLIAAMLLAHELTHVWQWQNRATTGYSPLRAASEHNPGGDPYLFEINEEPRFSEFAFEQQGSIVEEFVCCRALAPDAPRTERLHGLIAQVMPVAPLPSSPAYDVGLPWDGVDLKNICR
ncbi:hypothetical protein C1J03_16420 [Sulfitobacter sp. SK012]|uniref:hypothetical protein n=1 Tax=Sulfitobacter sp. SK012 TaxID=1389005 RepID=UPI000E0C5D02|nr:hypothetical protein [Sulfitobacter sp. SK012]AXI47451.1 hypothetical protein C1J03_16420 [Sulfitobacter sp. SK012]